MVYAFCDAYIIFVNPSYLSQAVAVSLMVAHVWRRDGTLLTAFMKYPRIWLQEWASMPFLLSLYAWAWDYLAAGLTIA